MGDTDADLDLKRDSGQTDGLVDGAGDSIRDSEGGFPANDPRAHDQELIPANPAERVACSDRTREAICHDAEQLVARRMAELVVDRHEDRAMLRRFSRLLRRARGRRSPAPPPPPHDFPTLEEMPAMLDPRWDPKKQWDGSPAMTYGSRIVTPSRPRTAPGPKSPKVDGEAGVS
jgi:hypothetical protein